MDSLTPGSEGIPAPEGVVRGSRLLRRNATAAVVFTVRASAAGVLGGAGGGVLVVRGAVMLVAGSVACLWAFAIAVQRSREVEIAPTQLYFLTGGCAPAVVRNRFLVLLAVQVVVGLVAAGIRPFTGVAFGILVPMFGLGAAGLWAARHGEFPERIARGGTDRSGGRGNRQE